MYYLGTFCLLSLICRFAYLFSFSVCLYFCVFSLFLVVIICLLVSLFAYSVGWFPGRLIGVVVLLLVVLLLFCAHGYFHHGVYSDFRSNI